MSYPAELGVNEGDCSRCGQHFARRKPEDTAICDCWKYCPICGKEMTEYKDDQAPSQYHPLKGQNLKGDFEHPYRVIRYCATDRYYSSALPIEVHLT